MFHSSPASRPAAFPFSGTAAVAAVAAAFLLAGCASADIDGTLRKTNDDAHAFARGGLDIDRTPAQRERRAALAQDLLSRPLSQNDAVQVALAHSPAVQALVAESWAAIAVAEQSGRLPNPIFHFERLRLGDELELGRLLSFGLMDLILLPRRLAVSRSQVDRAGLQLTAAVVAQVTQVRQAWVRAVGARQSLRYAEQVGRSAQASAELARRMESAGNFSKLQRARQQVFQADAATEVAVARHAAAAAREALVRALGLDDAQAATLALPERLPDLPAAPRDAREIAATASAQRLDMQLSKAALDIAGRSQGLDLSATFVDIEAGVRRDTLFDSAEGTRRTRRGFELGIRLPLFDWGGARRAAMNAQALAAAHRYDVTARAAASQLREDYSAYRTAYDIARHYRDDIVPLRQAMADENVLRYNAMLIGVFELLAEARDQIAGVSRAIDAQQRFWLADAALAASVIGTPAPALASASSNP